MSGPPDTDRADVVIVGSGAGGSTLAYALRNTGARILVIERGAHLPKERENWSAAAVFGQRRYDNPDVWTDDGGRPFHPHVRYFVGGSTKLYGASLARFREEDFGSVEHAGGTSRAWPFGYRDLEPYYAQAERLYRVHGRKGEDPVEPPRSDDFPFPEVPHEPYVADLAARFQQQGLRPFHLPMAVDVAPGGACICCNTCDGFPCLLDAKGDAETSALRPALASGSVQLLTRTTVTRILCSSDGRRAIGVEAERDDHRATIHAGTVVVSCGAVNSAALLLRSASAAHPNGLANLSGLVGQRYMQHHNTILLATDPRRRNTTSFQKTLGINDFYRAGAQSPYPLGHLQIFGATHGAALRQARPGVPAGVLDLVASRSILLGASTEDLPDERSRVRLAADGQIVVSWSSRNSVAHRRLLRTARAILRLAGYPFVRSHTVDVRRGAHQCGTVVAGDDPARSVLDPYCRAHEVPNLFVVDTSFFPSSGAVGPALTAMAQALRVGAEGAVLP
jgi:choline dehydrogenase-like flavoprotein